MTSVLGGLLSLLLLTCANASAAVVLDSGIINETSFAVGGYIALTSTFAVTGAELPRTQLMADSYLIDDGVEIVVNGTSLFAVKEPSQFGHKILS